MGRSERNKDKNQEATPTSPSATSAGTSSEEPWLDVVKKLLADLKTDMKQTVKNEIQAAVKSLENAHAKIDDLTKDKDCLEEKVSVLTMQIDSFKTREAALLKQNGELLERQIAIEAYSRRDNLLVYGIEQGTREDCMAKVLKFMKDHLQLQSVDIENMKIQRCHRLNAKISPQPVIIRFLYFPDRMKVWNARFKLKNSSYSLSEDFPPEIVARRKILYPILKAAKRDEVNCKMFGDKLELDGKIYTVNTISRLPPQYNPSRLSTIEKNGLTAFYTKSSPLSNFYPCKVVVGKHEYSCVEQYFQEQLALFGGKPEIAAQIRSSSDPARCKSLGGQVRVDNDQWLPEACEIMKRGCWAKFSKNDTLRDFLLNTGVSTLVEAGPDAYWGVGLKLNDPKLFETDLKDMKGQNRLGDILMAVRTELLLQN
jgi:ribA/ribD-fused uncharacterized protein